VQVQDAFRLGDVLVVFLKVVGEVHRLRRLSVLLALVDADNRYRVLRFDKCQHVAVFYLKKDEQNATLQEPQQKQRGA